MADLIIKKKDIEKLGKDLMKTVYEYFNDGEDTFILINKNDIEEIEIEKDELKKNLVKFYFDYILKNCIKIMLKNTNDKDKDKDTNDNDKDKDTNDNDNDNYKDKILNFYYSYISSEENKINIIKDKIENESLDIDFIYQILKNINKETMKKYNFFLKCKIDAFLNIYSTYKMDHKYLK